MNLWRTLTEPHPGVTGERVRRQARQFSGLVLGLLAVLLTLMAIWAALPEAGIKWPELVLLALFITGYGLSRTKAVRAGTILTIVGVAILVGATAIFQQDATPTTRLLVLGMLLIPLLLSTLLTDARATAAVGALNVAVIGASALLAPGMAGDEVALLLGINITGAILAVAVAALRQRDIHAVEQQMRDRQRDLDVTARISEQVSTVLDLDRLLPQMVDLTKDSFGLYHVHVYLYEPDSEMLRVAAGTGEAGRIMQESGHTIPLSAKRSLVARAGRSRQPVLIPDVALEPDYLPNPLLPLTRSEMAVPLVHGEDLIGVLDAQSERRGAFSEDTVPVMTTLAGQMAVAIINARAFTAVRQAQEETQAALDRVARQNRFSSGVAQFATTLLNRGIDGLGEALGPLGVAANASRVYFFENFIDEEGRLACRQVFEWVAEGIAGAENPHVPYEAALPHWKDDLFAGRPVRALRSETPPPERAILDEQDIESLLLIPVMVEGSFYGFVGFDDCQRERVWDEAEVDLLRTAGVSIAYAIAGARLLQKTQEALLQVEMLYQVGQSLMAAQSPEQILAAIYEAVKPAGPAVLSLFYFDASHEGEITSAELAAVYQADELPPMPEPGTQFAPADLPLIDLLAAHPHRIAAVSDIEQPGKDTPPALVTMLRQAGLRAAAFVPLVSPGQRWVGAVTVGWGGPHTLTEAEENLLALLAPQLATIAENLRLLHQTQRTEGLLRSFIDASPDWIWAKDRDFRFLIANKALAEQVFGTTPEDVIGKDDYAVAPAELVDGNPEKGIVGFRVDDRKALSGEIVHNPYDVVVHKDGSQHILDTLKFPLRDKNGNIIGTMGMGRDITEQHRARERERLAYELGQQLTRLLSPDELLHATVEQVAKTFGYYHAHIYLLDEEGEQLVVREGLGEAGQTMKQAGHRIPLNAPRSLVARAARTREPVVVNDVTRNPDHLPNPLLPLTRSEAAVPLVIGERLLGVLDVQHSQINHFDEHEIVMLSIVANQLAIALSNAELYQEQLETTERLREVDKLKSEFLANVSHELRTPLNSIIGYSELLIDEMGAEMDEMSLEDLKAIHSSGYHLLAIINDILDLAKIEAGRLELQKEPVALDTFIPQVIETTRVLLKDKPAVELLLEMPDGVPTIEADPVRLRQILWNLLSNAIKFTDEGYVRLTCRSDDGWMQFIVEDTGIGIPPDQKDAIFDQFRQVDGSPTRKQGGTGLGLTITRELVTMHGGTIALDSDVGRGTTFTVRLPLGSAAQPEAGAAQPQAGAAQPQKQANGREAVSAD